MTEKAYFAFTAPSRRDKAINTLLGLLEGIAADQTIDVREFELLNQWVNDNSLFIDRHPFSEMVPVVVEALADGKFTSDEQADLVWLCNRLRSTEYYDLITSDIQRLQGMMTAISADGVISESEIESLRSWMDDHTDLRTCFPYDELDSLITSVLADRWIDPVEHKLLLNYFGSFSVENVSLETPRAPIATLPGICAVTPEIVFDSRRFCFTGESAQAPREELKTMVLDRGGIVMKDVSPRLDYLVVGAAGNPCWAYACYGRKIEHAMQLRKQGARLLLVHENDFFDAC